MDEREWLTERFERHRSHLRAVACRMPGSVSEAGDALQEARLRIRGQDPARAENMQAWLTTAAGRVCRNMLRSRRARREELPVHVPDPVVAFDEDADPGHETLLVAVLDPDVELRIDGGVLRAEASLILRGAEAVAGHAATYSRLYPFIRPALVNGAAGAVVAPHGQLFSVMAFTVTDGKITRIDALVDPGRLAQLDLTFPDASPLALDKRTRLTWHRVAASSTAGRLLRPEELLATAHRDWLGAACFRGKTLAAADANQG